MTAPSPAIDHYRSEFAAVADRLAGSRVPWLARTRRDAMAQFADLGFPTARHENWKYTRLTPVEKRQFRTMGDMCVGLAPDDIEAHFFPGLDCHRLVFVNGRFARQLSRYQKLPDGVAASSLAQALTERPESLEPHLARYANPGAHGFSALNTAFMSDGAWVYLPAHTRLETPVHLIYVSTTRDDDIFIHPRNLVVAERESQAAIIESYVSLGGNGYLANALTEVILGDHARLDHYKLQEESDKAFHFATLQVQQGRESRFISHSVSFGSALARNDINVALGAEGAECALHGLYVVGGRQHVDYHTRVDHIKPRTTSHEYYKGVLSGRSRGVFNGQVYVHPDAQQTDARQSNHNLLLSRDAEIDTKPQLEIFADDVKCAHGATVGQLDNSMIFYLRTRGMDESTARGLLTFGFARDALSPMEIEAVRSTVHDHLVQRLPNADQIKGMIA